MNREVAYLQIPEGYFRGWDRVPRWSAAGDVIEWPDGAILAFGVEVATFLEGYALIGPLIHFAHVAHLLATVDRDRAIAGPYPGPPGLGGRSGPLVRAFREAGKPLRNLGALCAWLCREVAPVADPPDLLELGLRLSNGAMLSALAVRRWATSALADEGEDPTIDAEEFESRFLRAVGGMTPAAIVAWLEHGRGPEEDHGDRVAGAIVALKPRLLDGALAAIAGRDRLAGSVPMVTQLVGALTLPPRRLADQALPSGGYADVATRGRPEQILPGQFAIEGVEFLRRFAENELLYFHREEPHAPVAEELVLLLDQGVRTWGRVRLALAASALAFGKLAARRKLPLLVGSTGTDGRLLDPSTTDPEALGAFWEASDLTPGPALALERVLEAKGPGTRDVVVLTHPRGAAEEDFASATRRAGAGTRVFSVAIDDSGRVEFREWRHGHAVKVGDFRVDFAPDPAAGRPITPAGPDLRGWTGDVEPVGFPFRLDVVHRLDRPLFDFDHAGRWLLLGTDRGMLHAWALDGSRAEVLPRAVVDGDVMEQVDAVLGVADGFVVAGRVGKSLVAMHYDLPSRAARAHVLGPTFDAEWRWFYARGLHTVVARGRTYSRSLDLATREVHRSRESAARPPIRAIRAFEMASNHALPPPWLAVVDEATPAPPKGQSVRLDRDSGEVRLSGVSPPWGPFTPLSDGRPSLRGFWVDHAQLRGEVLALVVSSPDRRWTSLRLFHGPSGTPARQLPPASTDPGRFMLSADGRLLARRLGERQLEVRETAGNGLPVFSTGKSKGQSEPRLILGRYGMIVRVGKHAHLIRWDGDRLAFSPLHEGAAHAGRGATPWPIERPATRSTPLPPHLDYDPRRFVACARAELTAVVDASGQVALFDRRDRLLAMVLAHRGQVAAWMPDGTRLGPGRGTAPLIDGPATPDAAEIIGRALKVASDA